ncbi:40S ribosomal protein SA-like [Leopardus geoffroyi]|uniref:40S ribosomal protein SA-like n=1 Tax=Leopardus geoffroyi TaxID=46844 RepID=UPI001E260F79|nr:40S ribosomal protein SA-like [Leopardus geoffroyi]
MLREYWPASCAELFFCPGATLAAGCFTSGAFTKQIQAAFRERRSPVVTESRADHQPFTAASHMHLPTTALYNTPSSVFCVHCHLTQQQRVGSRSESDVLDASPGEVLRLRLRATIFCEQPGEVTPGLYFCRDTDE